MAHHFLITRLNQGFYGAAFAKYLINVFFNSDIVELPGVNVIGVEQLQRNFEVFERGIAGAFFGLGGNKNLITVALKALTYILLTPPVRSSERLFSCSRLMRALFSSTNLAISFASSTNLSGSRCVSRSHSAFSSSFMPQIIALGGVR